MDIKLVPATVTSVNEMCECGRRAFANDGLDNAVFPPRLRNPTNEEEIYKFRMERIGKRVQSPNWHYVLATTVPVDGHAQIVGYAGWVAPALGNESKHKQGNDLAKDQVEEQSQVAEAENFPNGMDIDAFNFAMETVEKAKKETLGEDEQKVWYLMSLAVDPEFAGRGIASSLVKWGLAKADRDGLPAYLESTPAAVGMYKRLGFEELRGLHVIKDNESYFLTVMKWMPDVGTDM
ncbi:acyl-CoA N-acyltransferase [Lindgomyces ingoldianus]|uniref:Acyl-CoA N-acyltransferase n=1 Tax=Lindgomyces ingoldianus TaxID=673940 RepID=A0ACB6QEM8_9PLEO|nr:acyl-CoA N-acyltransferase [Lindgomyces ingoldianus]KAF2464817.1 acyl-CoA N-acyltransferase [Lindgomyces ingoldianus]